MQHLMHTVYRMPTHTLWVCAGIFALFFGFPNKLVHLPVLVLLYPVALYSVGNGASSVRQAFLRGWLCSALGTFSVMYWVAQPIVLVGGLHWTLALLCACFVSVGLGSSGGLFALASQKLCTFPMVRRVCLLGILWYLLEYMYAKICAFPWLPLSAALAAWPVCIQAAAVIGAFALSGVFAALSLLAAESVKSRKCRCAFAVLLLSLAVPSAARLLIFPQENFPRGPGTSPVLFVEGNIDQNHKWDAAFQQKTVDIYLDLTRRALIEHGDEKPLVVWPETAMPFYFQNHPLHTPRILDFASHYGINMIVGAPAYEYTPESRARSIFNRAFLVGSSGKIDSYYDKQYLVPFGEYLPPWLDFDILKPLMQGVGIYSHGTHIAPLKVRELAIGMLICYEAVFPELADNAVAQGANVLADISNDGWFGSSAAPNQHLYLTVLRAVEQGRWLFRGTNTGISAVCDPYGRIVVSGKRDTAESVSGRIRLVSEVTLFHTFGKYIPLVALVFVLLLLMKRKNTQRRKT